MRQLTLALALVLAAACGKGGDSTGPKPNLANGSMSAKFDGVQWNATASVRATSTNGIIGVAGTDASFQTLAFALAARAPGSYNIGSASAANAELTSGGNVWSAAGNIGGGVITITSLTTTGVAGTFSFTMMKGGVPRNVTDGKFDIKF
ncbi:MAG TPA: DUF6252 family protein [Longimicrobiales bacterium]